MISKKSVRELVKKNRKRIGEEGLKELDGQITSLVKIKIEKAVRNADMAGRVVLKKEDFS